MFPHSLKHASLLTLLGAAVTLAIIISLGFTLSTKQKLTSKSAEAQLPAVAAVDVEGASSHSLVLMSDGRVFATGDNSNGKLGDGTTTNTTTAVEVLNISTANGIAAGLGSHSVAVLSDGTVWSWGNGSFGQMGNNTGNATNSTPVQATGISTAVAVAAGSDHTLALLSDGTVRAWGYNGSGQLGDGTTLTRLTPVTVSGLTNIIAIGAGGQHSLAVKSDGIVWTWGSNISGQLGDGTITFRPAPVQVSGITTATKVDGGNAHSIALLTDGTVRSWGLNVSGQLGDGTTTDRLTPVQVSGLSGITDIGAGANYSLARKSDGTAWGWGVNSGGQLGDGTTTGRLTPLQVSGLLNVSSVSGGQNHSLAINANTAVAWGFNGSGQLGDGTTTNRSLPIQMAVSIPVCTPAPANMISWWKGENDATDTQDGNHGALLNGATFAAGKGSTIEQGA